MENKRIELYVWWTCNHRCIYCMEYPNMIKRWNEKISSTDILKLLVKYRKLWYNHVTFLWWEPFIQDVFLDALKIAKKLWYTILVTTNATTLHIQKEAAKYLPYIDELILSVEAIDTSLQESICQTKSVTYWTPVFENIRNYATLKLFKANIVVNQLNKDHIYEIVDFLEKHWIKEVVLTYPDIDILFYEKEYILEKIAPKYSEVYDIIDRILIDFSPRLTIKIADIPFCILKNAKYLPLTDDYNYENRIKLAAYNKKNSDYSRNNKTLNRKKISPRKRKRIEKCKTCSYNKICWWVSDSYDALYWLDEIQPISNSFKK